MRIFRPGSNKSNMMITPQSETAGMSRVVFSYRPILSSFCNPRVEAPHGAIDGHANVSREGIMEKSPIADGHAAMLMRDSEARTTLFISLRRTGFSKRGTQLRSRKGILIPSERVQH